MKVPTAFDFPRAVPEQTPAPALLERLPRGAGEAFGEAVGRQISRSAQQIGGDFQTEHEAQTRAAAHLELLDAETDLKGEFINEMTKPGGYNELRGEDARRTAPIVLGKLNKKVEEIQKRLQYPITQSLFAARAKGMVGGFANHINQRAIEQTHVAAEASLKSNLVTSMDAVAAGYTFGRDIQQELAAREGIITEAGISNGWGAD